MKCFTLIALTGAVSASSLSLKFMEYITQHGKSYATVEEFEFRKARFALADEAIAAMNQNEANTWTAGHNKFSDWT